MQIKIITPTHIGNGQSYPSYAINNNNVYDADDIFNQLDIDLITNKQFLRDLSNEKIASTMSFESITTKYGAFKIDYSNLEPKYVISSFQSKHKNYKVYETEKDFNKLIIPGSTFKGYLRNLIIYDVLSKNRTINEEFIHSKGKNETELNELFRFLIVPDISFNEKTEIKCITRYGKKEGASNNIEVIPAGAISNPFEIIIDKSINDYDAKPGFQRKVKDILLNFNNWFLNANKEFIDVVLEYEKRSIINSISFDYKIELDKLKKEGTSNLIQIGKFTNFIDKSLSHALIDYYENFIDKYSPNKKNKKEPIIESVNLINEKTPLGFIRIIL